MADAEDNPVITKAMLETQLDDLVNEITVLETQIAQKMQQRDVIQQQLSEFEADEQIAPVREDNKPELCLSSIKDKADFMLQLFSPRLDVFASREWSGKSKKGISYFPAFAFIGAERAAPDLINPISGNYARTATCSSEHILLQMR